MFGPPRMQRLVMTIKIFDVISSDRFDHGLQRSEDLRKHWTRRDFLCPLLEIYANFFFCRRENLSKSSKGPEPESTVTGSARLSRPAIYSKGCGYSFGQICSRVLKQSLALLVTDRVSNEDLSKMQNFCDTGMHENSIILTCNQVFLFSTRKLAYQR